MQKPIAKIRLGLLALVLLCGCSKETATGRSTERTSSSPLALKIHHALQQGADWRTLVDPSLARVLTETMTDPLAALEEIVRHQLALTQLAESAAARPRCA